MRSGDLVCVRGSNWLSKGILKATGCAQDGPSHVAVGINDKECVEALGSGVVRRPLVETLQGCERAWVLSFENLSDAERQQIAFAAQAMIGLKYGYLELGVQLLDSVFRTTWWTDRWSTNLNSTPICSYVAARAYSLVRGEQFNRENQSVTPGDIYRYGLKQVSLKEATMERAV